MFLNGAFFYLWPKIIASIAYILNNVKPSWAITKSTGVDLESTNGQFSESRVEPDVKKLAKVTRKERCKNELKSHQNIPSKREYAVVNSSPRPVEPKVERLTGKLQAQKQNTS